MVVDTTIVKTTESKWHVFRWQLYENKLKMYYKHYMVTFNELNKHNILYYSTYNVVKTKYN